MYCWFALDVLAAMLVVKNKTISVLWELNIFRGVSKQAGDRWSPTGCLILVQNKLVTAGVLLAAWF